MQIRGEMTWTDMYGLVEAGGGKCVVIGAEEMMIDAGWPPLPAVEVDCPVLVATSDASGPSGRAKVS